MAHKKVEEESESRVEQKDSRKSQAGGGRKATMEEEMQTVGVTEDYSRDRMRRKQMIYYGDP